MTEIHGARRLTCLAAALLLGGSASAQWSESFEGYADGSTLEGQGGWHGWDGIDTDKAVITSQFASEGTQSVQILGGADTVHEFDGYDSGKWMVLADVYTPSWFVGKAYFLVMNLYTDNGPYQWSVQIGFNGDTGDVECNCGSGTPSTIPLVHDEWIEVRCIVDFSTDVTEIYYDDNLLGTYPWSAGPFGSGSYGLPQIDAIDLYSDASGYPHVTEIYFDNLRVQAFQGVIGTTYCFGDGSGASCPCGNTGGLEEGCAHGAGVGATLSAFGSAVAAADDLVFTGEQMVASQPALLFAANNTINGGHGLPFGDGLRCAGGGLVRLGVKMADGAGTGIWGPGLAAAGGWLAGDTRRFQAWYRDPVLSPCAAFQNLTPGLEIAFVP
jgi:hypothetical protein